MAIGYLNNNNVARYVSNDLENKNLYPVSQNTENKYFSGLSQDDLRNSVANMNLSNPDSYLQSALDVAMYNNDASQALAREQMKFQTEANAKAMEFNANEAAKTRDYTLMMSNTAHQREVADLIAAGLNPILSANQGASTGSFANANGVTSSGAKGSIDTGLIGAITNAYTQAMNLQLQNKQIDAQLAMNLINNETNRYAADKGAYSSMYSAGLVSSANRYSADMSYSANKYANDLNAQLRKEGYYNPEMTLINAMVDKFLNSQTINNAKGNRDWNKYIFGEKGVNTPIDFVGDLMDTIKTMITPTEVVRR